MNAISSCLSLDLLSSPTLQSTLNLFTGITLRLPPPQCRQIFGMLPPIISAFEHLDKHPQLLRILPMKQYDICPDEANCLSHIAQSMRYETLAQPFYCPHLQLIAVVHNTPPRSRPQVNGRLVLIALCSPSSVPWVARRQSSSPALVPHTELQSPALVSQLWVS